MKTFDSLDDTFGITPEDKKESKAIEAMSPKPIKRVKPDITISNKSEDQEKDYQYARAQLYDLVEKMQESINGAMEAAYESGHPRAHEVALNGAKAASEVVEKLGDLHKKMNDIEKQEGKPNVSMSGGTQNNIFMTGSTADLMKALKDVNSEE